MDDPITWYEGSGTTLRRSLHPDHQGSIAGISQGTGTLLTVNRYDEYGIPAATNLGRFQYTGQAWIHELGMYYYKARIYSPTLGRFMQTDPIGYEDQVNLYAYVGNDPVNAFDPSGSSCATPVNGVTAGCRVDGIAIVLNDPVKGPIVIGSTPVAPEDEPLFEAFNDRYTAATNELLANPNRTVTVAAIDGDKGSFTITAAEAAASMIARTTIYVGPSSGGDTLFVTAGGPGVDGKDPRTYVYQEGLDQSHKAGIVHDFGLHGTPQENSGGLQTPDNPLNKLDHQNQYNRASCRLLGQSPSCSP